MNNPHWTSQPFVAYDSETTGVSVAEDRIVTACLVHIEQGAQPRRPSHLIDPGIDIPEEATAIHGITTEHARTYGTRPAEALDVIAADLALSMVHGSPVVGMNVSFDLSMLEHELRRYGLPTLHERLDGQVRPVVDVFAIDKHIDPYRRGSRKLVDMCAHYKVLIEDAHDAASDAIAAARLAWVMVRGDDNLRDLTLDDLHDSQVAWRAEQCASLQAYFRRQAGREADVVDSCWPVCSGHDLAAAS